MAHAPSAIVAVASLAAAAAIACNAPHPTARATPRANECATTPRPAAAPCAPLPTPVVTELPLATTLSSGPAGIVLGPDGNLWFALESSPGAIRQGWGRSLARMSPDGSSLQEFAISDDLAGPMDVAVGPDGKIWFTEFTRARIGRISTDGTGLADFVVPGRVERHLGPFYGPPRVISQPNGIAVGPRRRTASPPASSRVRTETSGSSSRAQTRSRRSRPRPAPFRSNTRSRRRNTPTASPSAPTATFGSPRSAAKTSAESPRAATSRCSRSAPSRGRSPRALTAPCGSRRTRG